MHPYSSKDWADPGKPTQKELNLWLLADPTRGLGVIQIAQEEYAAKKATLSRARRKREAARIRKDAHLTARFVLNHLFEIAERIPGHPRLFRRDPDAMPKQIEMLTALMKLAGEYLPHMMMPERAKWRTLLKATSTLIQDVVALTRASITRKPTPAAL